jgi:hypothetical protein
MNDEPLLVERQMPPVDAPIRTIREFAGEIATLFIRPLVCPQLLI